MLAVVDGHPVAADTLGVPAMNFGQFNRQQPVGRYELTIARPELVDRLTGAYSKCVAELQADDLLQPHEPSLLRDAAYPPLGTALDNPKLASEMLGTYLYDALFDVFIPHSRFTGHRIRFALNSVDAVRVGRSAVVVAGRGYHVGVPPASPAAG